MDEQFMAMMGCDPGAAVGATTLDVRVQFLDDTSGEIAILDGEDDPSPRNYTLKPLSQLYGPGTPDRPVDPQDDAFMPLFLAIEQTIVRCDDLEPTMTDGAVSLALDLLAMDPQADLQHDTLARRIQLELRLLLSLNDYARQEVRQALRKVHKSVARHSRLSGRRGYLDFIRQYVGG